MKKLFFLLLAVSLFSCSKIKENRLTGAWTLSRWELTDDAGNTVDGTVEFDDRIGGEVRLEFIDDNTVLLQDYAENDIVSEEAGTWSVDEGVDNITFPDSIWIFNQDVTYSIDQLKRGELVISGVYNTNRRNYPSSTLTFVTR